jgi:hypothetical protein
MAPHVGRYSELFGEPSGRFLGETAVAHSPRHGKKIRLSRRRARSLPHTWRFLVRNTHNNRKEIVAKTVHPARIVANDPGLTMARRNAGAMTPRNRKVSMRSRVCIVTSAAINGLLRFDDIKMEFNAACLSSFTSWYRGIKPCQRRGDNSSPLCHNSPVSSQAGISPQTWLRSMSSAGCGER